MRRYAYGTPTTPQIGLFPIRRGKATRVITQGFSVKEVSLSAAAGIILLSLGIYQIIAALLAIFFWMVAGDWHAFISQIIVIAFWINLPATYWIWQRWLHAGEKRINH